MISTRICSFVFAIICLLISYNLFNKNKPFLSNFGSYLLSWLAIEFTIRGITNDLTTYGVKLVYEWIKNLI